MKQSKKQENIFSLYDLGCASALLSKGYELKKLDRSNPKRVCFMFADTEGIQGDANAYLANTLEVKARGFYDALKALKSRIYQG